MKKRKCDFCNGEFGKREFGFFDEKPRFCSKECQDKFYKEFEEKLNPVDFNRAIEDVNFSVETRNGEYFYLISDKNLEKIIKQAMRLK